MLLILVAFDSPTANVTALSRKKLRAAYDDSTFTFAEPMAVKLGPAVRKVLKVVDTLDSMVLRATLGSMQVPDEISVAPVVRTSEITTF